jgi:hypothetical protein
VQYNAVSKEMLELAKLCTQRTERVPNRIGYFAGGASHGPDLEDISVQLAEAIVERDAEFFCVETVKVPQVLLDTNRVVTTPRMSYVGMLKAYSTCSITIAPLHMNEFTSSKSGIKYLEASLVGAVCVATPIPDIVRIGDERLVTISNLAGWKEGILEGLRLPCSADTTQAQQDKIKKQYTTAIEGRRLREFLDDLIAQLPSRARFDHEPTAKAQATIET